MWEKAICPYDCPASCGLLVKVENGKITEVRGNHLQENEGVSGFGLSF